MKRFLILLVCVMLLSSLLFSCDSQGEKPSETAGIETKEPFSPDDPVNGEIDRSGDYTYNPRLLAAYRVNDTTVRIRFSSPVAGQQHILTKSIVACEDRSFKTRIGCTEAYPINAVGNSADTLIISDTWELIFKSKLPASPVICITEPEKYENGDPVMEKIFFGSYGEGLYAGDKYGKLNAEIVECGKEKIEGEKDGRPHILWADVINASTGLAQIKFSEPVACIQGNMENHLFICDSANPAPGAGASWQIGTKGVKAVNGQNKGGRQYASVWEFYFAESPAQHFGVIRISENDSGAADEFGSANDNDDIGRVLVGISGKPVRAEYYAGWDVAYTQFDVSDILGG